MVAPELSTRRAIAIAGATVIALTGMGIALGALDPRLAGQTPPHPTLTGTLGDALDILQNNLRVLAAPYLLWLLGFHRHLLTRRAGDLLVLALAAASTLPVGVELGRWRARLVPYLPQLPLEWAALALAISAWLLIRTPTTAHRHTATLAVFTVVLLGGAASLETWCTPRRPASPALGQAEGRAIKDRARPVGVGGCRRSGLCAAGGRVAARSHAPFPSLRSVPLGRLAALTGLPSPPPTPTRRDRSHERRTAHRKADHRRPDADHQRRHPGRQPAPGHPTPPQGR